MCNKLHAFQPKRIGIGFWCSLIFLGILVNMHYLLNDSSLFFYIPLFFLIGMFVFLFVPFLKNQKLLISDKELIVFTFGYSNKLNFCMHLKEIVVKENEIVSYRFENNGKYFQISPEAYYENEELKELFTNLKEKCKELISIIER